MESNSADADERGPSSPKRIRIDSNLKFLANYYRIESNMKSNSADADERGQSSSKRIRLDSLSNFCEVESNLESNESNATETNKNPIFPPISSKIKVDLGLKYTSDRYAPKFNEKDKVKQHMKNFLGNKSNVDQFKRKTSYLFPYNMYWKFLTTAENLSTSNGYFGATFWNLEREQVVIAHRGTELTNIGAVWTDIKSIYGNKVSLQMSSAVTFTHYVQRIFAEIDKECGTHFKMFMTGHSLGAWLAQICTFSVKYLTIMDNDNTYFVKSMEEGHHAHTVVFDSPGCKPMLQQLQREFDVKYDNVEKLPIDCLDITSYLSAPNRVNTCNPHVGKIYRVFIDFSNKSFFNEYNLYTHKVKNILKTFDKETGLFEQENGKFKIHEVVDWPETSILNKDEYNNFFKWATEFNNYHPTYKNVKFKDYYPIRYQTKEFNERQCSLNVFSQSDQQFLKQYQSVRQFSNFFNLNKLFDEVHLKILNKLSIDESNHLVGINKGSIVELYDTLSYVRQLLFKFPEKSEILKTWLSHKSIVEITYKNVSISYLHSNKKWLKFKTCENFEKGLVEFLNNPNKIVWKIEVTSGDTFCTLKQIYCTFLEKIKKESIFNYTEQHCIVLDIKSLLQKNRDIKLLDYLKLTKSYSQLLIIEYNPNQFDNNDDLIKMFSSNLFEEIKSSKSCKIILCAKQNQILKNILSTNLDELCKETKAEGFTWNDLNEESQKELLNRKIVFQEKEKKLNDLTDDFNIKDEIGQLIDHDSLIKLINDNNKIEIGSKSFGIENLEGAYADLYKEVNNETLKYNLIKNSKKAIYFISGLFENNDENRALEELVNIFNYEKNIIADKINYLKSPFFFQSNNNKYIHLVDSQFKEEDFNTQFDKHLNNKKMFWINLKEKKFILQKLYNPDFYIKRKFHSVLLKIDKKMFKTNECFVFSGVDCVETLATLFKDSSIKTKKKIFIKQTSEDAEVKLNKLNDIAHWIEVKTIESKNQLVWRDSKGSIQNIRQYINDDVKLLEDEDSLVDLVKNKQTIILADDPGMGKSTTLVQLYYSKLKYNNINVIESNWIIHVNLRDHVQTIKSYFNDDIFKIEIFLEFLSKIDSKLSNIISQNLLKYSASNCNHMSLLMSFDGFDELQDSKERSKIIKLLKFLKNDTKVKIWITTRMHYCKKLENALSTIAIKFNPMDKQSIKLFIVEYLKARLSLILDYQAYKSIFAVEKNEIKLTNEFTEQFLNKMESLFKGDISRFIGTPLQLHLLLGAKGFIDNFVQWTYNTEQPFNFDYMGKDICSVYEYFINNKYDILFRKMSNLSDVVQKQLKNQFNDYCVELASETIFSLMSKKMKNIEFKELFLSLGYILLDKQNNLKFIHQTFGEYYASEKCINWIKQNDEFDISTKKIKFVLQVLKNENYRNVRSFINIKLNKLKNDIMDLDKICEQYGTIINSEINLNHSNLLLNQEGYTVLDLAAKEGNLNIVNFLLTSCKKFENGLVKKLILTKKNILKINPLHIAVNFNNVEIIEKIFSFFVNNKNELIECIKDKDHQGDSVLHISVRNNNIEIIERLIPLFDNNKNELIKWIKDKNEYDESLLHIAAQYKSVKAIERLIPLFDNNKNELFEWIKDKDPINISVSHIAAEQNYYEFFEKLISLFDNNKNELNEWIKDKDRYGDTVLHLAVRKNNKEIIERLYPLFDNNKNAVIECIKDKNKNGFSVLHLAGWKNNIEIIERLIPLFDNNKNELIEWIKDKNQYGDSVLHLAGMENNVEIIERLIPLFDNNKNELIEWIKDKNQYGDSVLHVSAYYNSIKFVKRLIPLFDNNKNELIEWIKDKDHQGDSVLHISVRNNNIEIIERLIPLFDNNKNELIKWIKDKNEYDESLLHIAAQYKSVKAIERLIPLFDNNKNELFEWIKDKDPINISVSHIAAEQNYYEFFEKLISLFDNNKNELNEWIKDKDRNGDTVLHLAVRKNNKEIIERLYPLFDNNKNAVIECIKDKNENGFSVLHLAGMENNVEIIERLIPLFDNNKNELIEWIKDKTEDGNSVLHLAVKRNNIEIIEKLIPLFDNNKHELIVWIKDKNKYNESVLHLAAKYNNVKIIEKLISLFDNNKSELIEWIKDKNKDGESVLHLAVRENNIKIIEKLTSLFDNHKNELIEWIKDKTQNGNSVLHLVVKRNNIEIIEKLIPLFDNNKSELIEWIKDKNKDGESVLHLAVRENNIKIIEKLTSLFDNHKNELIEWIKDKNKDGESVLHLAVKENNIEIIEKSISLFDNNNNELIECIKDKNHNGDSVLHLAVWKNYIEIIEKLIPLFDNNKNELIELIKDKTKQGNSVLHLAALYKSVETIERLIPLFDNNKNELIELIKDKTKQGNSVLHLAGWKNNIEIIERLIPLFDNNKNELIEWIKDKNQNGESVLHLAAQYKSVETIERLIPLFDNNKNELIELIKDKNQNGESVLHLAVWKNNIEIIERLIPLFDNNKNELIELIKDKEQNGCSVLHLAALYKSVETIERLIPLFDNNKNELIELIKDKTKQGNSVLHLAGWKNNIEIIERLIPLFDNNKNELIEWIKDKTKQGNSVLHLAGWKNNIEIIERLIPLFDNNKNELIEWIKDKNQNGESVLHLAAQYKSVETIERLILLFDNNKNELIEWIKDKDQDGESVLHLAVWENNIEIIERLIPLFDNNKNELIEWIKDKNQNGESVLHLAAQYKSVETIERLILLFDNNKNELIELIKDKTKQGNSVLHLAGWKNNIEIIERLIPLFDNNKNELIELIKDKEQNGYSVLHIAAQYKSVETIERLILLFDNNKNELIELIKDKTKQGNSVLHLAGWKNNIEIIERLIPLFDNNKNELIELIKDKEQNGYSVLHIAAWKNNIEIIERLIPLFDNNKNELIEWIKDKNQNGDSVLHLAAWKNNIEIIERLIPLIGVEIAATERARVSFTSSNLS
ncbi:hypothetical protein BLOT_011149 [Blomia tropicalis]|nr:hypothetical protein BLOT_011149 [Blomia tropicalis]